MAIKVFYHVAALNHWEMVVRDHVAKLIFSSLYDVVEAVVCICVGPEAERAGALLRGFGAKFHIHTCDSEDKSGERKTLMAIPSLVTAEDQVLYIHSKGVTKIPPSEPVYYWQWYMDYFLIKDHARCRTLLKDHDVVGLDFYPLSKPHFSGNFWWARGDWIHQLALYDGPEEADKYTHTETWVCGGHSPALKARLFQLAHSRLPLYTVALKPSAYVDGPIVEPS